MTTDDEWLKERAWAVVTRHDGGVHAQHVGALAASITAFGREAISRTRAEERALAAEALRTAHAMQEQAVAAERERCEARIAVLEKRCNIAVGNCETYRGMVDADVVELLDRLRNPDEALVEAVRKWMQIVVGYGFVAGETPANLCRALAHTLTEGKENSDG